METNTTGASDQTAVRSKVVTQSPDGPTHIIATQTPAHEVETSTGVGAGEIILRVVCLVSYVVATVTIANYSSCNIAIASYFTNFSTTNCKKV